MKGYAAALTHSPSCVTLLVTENYVASNGSSWHEWSVLLKTGHIVPSPHGHATSSTQACNTAYPCVHPCACTYAQSIVQSAYTIVVHLLTFKVSSIGCHCPYLEVVNLAKHLPSHALAVHKVAPFSQRGAPGSHISSKPIQRPASGRLKLSTCSLANHGARTVQQMFGIQPPKGSRQPHQQQAHPLACIKNCRGKH